MIAWWWLIPAFYTGLTFGIFLIALLQANKLTETTHENPPYAHHNPPRSPSTTWSGE